MSLLRHYHPVDGRALTFDPTESAEVRQRLEGVLRALEPQDAIAIRQTQNRILFFTITAVQEIKKSRIYTVNNSYMGSNGWHAKSGKSIQFPTGQSSLVEVSEAVKEFIAAHPNGTSSYLTRHHPLWEEPSD